MGIPQPSKGLALAVIQCKPCLACCSYAGVPPFEPDELEALLPEQLRQETMEATRNYQRMKGESTDCSWLDRKAGRCIHYDQRPKMCREFEVGESDCLIARRQRGIGDG